MKLTVDINISFAITKKYYFIQILNKKFAKVFGNHYSTDKANNIAILELPK